MRASSLLRQLSWSFVLIASFAAPIQAATTSFDSLALWQAQAGNYLTEDLETTPLGGMVCSGPSIYPCPAEIVIVTPSFDIVIPPGSDYLNSPGIHSPGSIDGSREYRADLHAGVLVEGISSNTFQFSQPITAFAVDLAGVVDYDTFGSGAAVPYPITFDIPGPGLGPGIVDSFAIAFGSTFFGVVSDQPFTSVVVRSTDLYGGYAVLPSFDNFRFVPIPEPSTALNLVLGLVVLATCSSRRGFRSMGAERSPRYR